MAAAPEEERRLRWSQMKGWEEGRVAWGSPGG